MFILKLSGILITLKKNFLNLFRLWITRYNVNNKTCAYTEENIPEHTEKSK